MIGNPTMKMATVRQIPIHETPLGSSKRLDPFDATRMWKEVLRTLYAEMPLETNRRQLRYFPETFCGKEAIDRVEKILPKVFSRNCNRTSAKNLLEKFVSFGYIANARDESAKDFCDNATLYRFCNDRIDDFLNEQSSGIGGRRKSNTNLLMRTASVRDSRGGGGHQQMDPAFESCEHFGKSSQNGEWFNNQRLNNRLSISCQDISSAADGDKHQLTNGATTTTKKGSIINLSGLVESFGKASASLFSLHRSNSESARVAARRLKTAGDGTSSTNPKALADWVLRESTNCGEENNGGGVGGSRQRWMGERGEEAPAKVWRNQNPKSVFKTTTNGTESKQRLLPQPSRAQCSLITMENTSSVFTVADEFKCWHTSLINGFKHFASSPSDDLSRFLPSNFSGADVRWNLRQISSTGIVQRLRDQNAELSRDLISSLRCLAQWTRSTTGSPVKDPLDLFTSIQASLSKMAPIIPQEQAQCLLNIFDHFETKLVHFTGKQQNITEKRLPLCVRLCTLTFPPQLLRALQTLIKFIRQILSNTKLMAENCWSKLEERRTGKRISATNNENNNVERSRHFLLRSLYNCFFAKSSIPKSNAVNQQKAALSLFKLMVVDHFTDCLLHIPKWLEEDVKRQTTQTFASSNQPPVLHSSFCDRIDKTEYEAQSRDNNQHLVELLDQILANENLSSAQKFEQLKKFRLAYPTIYSQRFPAHNCDDPLREAAASSATENIFSAKHPLIRSIRRLASS